MVVVKPENDMHINKVYIVERGNSQKRTDIFDIVRGNIYRHYENIYHEYYKNKASLNLIALKAQLAKLTQDIDKSISDISAYDDALNLPVIMNSIFKTSQKYSDALSKKDTAYCRFLCPDFHNFPDNKGAINYSINFNQPPNILYSYTPELLWKNDKFTLSFSGLRYSLNPLTNYEDVGPNDMPVELKRILNDLFDTFITPLPLK